MIYYASSHKSGARKLAYKYDLRFVKAKMYLNEKDLRPYGVINDREKLFEALHAHPKVHAYVLPNLRIYFHPDTVIPIIAEACKKYLTTLV